MTQLSMADVPEWALALIREAMVTASRMPRTDPQLEIPMACQHLTSAITEPKRKLRVTITLDAAPTAVCWHLRLGHPVPGAPPERVSPREARLWARALAGDGGTGYLGMLWAEPGSGDQRGVLHLRLFIDPEQGGKPVIGHGRGFGLTLYNDHEAVLL